MSSLNFKLEIYMHAFSNDEVYWKNKFQMLQLLRKFLFKMLRKTLT